MYDFNKLEKSYLEELAEFLFSIKWMFYVLNTQFVGEEILSENENFINTLSKISFKDLNEFPELSQPNINHPKELQKLIEQVNKFRINYDTIITDHWKSSPVRKISVKKQYEIENVSKVINDTCKDDLRYIIDFGSGLGYLTHYISEKYGFNALGLEGSDDRVDKARQHQVKYFPNSMSKVKHEQHFITSESEKFILKCVNDDVSDLIIFGLHGCGDLTVTAINLFLTMQRVKKILFMPCCYHKMTPKDEEYYEFNHFPLSEELKEILRKYPRFLNRPFLRLAGQQSPAKWKDMNEKEHWIHGKNMFERALVEALMEEGETTKRIKNVIFPDGQVMFDDIKIKYQLIDKSSGRLKEWKMSHENKFNQLRKQYEEGEMMSERLFCLQTTIQSNCENLVLIDRIRYIEEQGKKLNLNLKISVKKLQNEKLSPRCLILIVEK